jgi:alkylation response protein AidB-like acyl-CoA dehydrogenase
VCVRTVTNAMQIFGGYSYSKEYPIERYYRDRGIAFGMFLTLRLRVAA